MVTSAQLYFDAALRHQVGVRRFASGLWKDLELLLAASDRAAAEILRARLSKLAGRRVPRNDPILGELLRDLREARASRFVTFAQTARQSIIALGPAESAFEAKMLDSAMPFPLELKAPAASDLRAIAISEAFEGRALGEWFAKLRMDEQWLLRQAIRRGLDAGESTQAIVRRVVGTRARRFSDGALSITRRHAEAIVRTAVNHVSNSARSAQWTENLDIVGARMWAATLDGRTTAICRARDGKAQSLRPDGSVPEGFEKLPASAQLPAHIGERSVWIALIDGVGVVGTRPFVQDVRRRGVREVEFRREARQRGVPIKQVRAEWAAEHIGSVPAKTSYNEWLRRQPAAFQDDVLGPKRGRLFRLGGLSVDQFVDREGATLTLEQLSGFYPDAFAGAGLSLAVSA